MDYRELGRSGLKVSAVGLGCVTFGREINDDDAFAVMDRALEQGINLFDTAEAYSDGRSEELVGQWLAQRRARDRIVVATKVRPPLGRARILACAEASLRRLRVETIDLYQLHSWDPDTPLEENLAALDQLVRQGKVRCAGCSNFSAGELRRSLALAAARGWQRLESVQSNYNLVVREIEAELLPACAEQQVGLLSYSPLGAGFLTGKYYPGGPVPEGTRLDYVPAMQPIYMHPAGFRIVEGLRARAAELGTTMSRLALAWAMSQPGIASVLIGARSAGQVDQALLAWATGMSPGLRAELSAL